MTVKELRQALRDYPENMQVVIRGATEHITWTSIVAVEQREVIHEDYGNFSEPPKYGGVDSAWVVTLEG